MLEKKQDQAKVEQPGEKKQEQLPVKTEQLSAKQIADRLLESLTELKGNITVNIFTDSSSNINYSNKQEEDETPLDVLVKEGPKMMKDSSITAPQLIAAVLTRHPEMFIVSTTPRVEVFSVMLKTRTELLAA